MTSGQRTFFELCSNGHFLALGAKKYGRLVPDILHDNFRRASTANTLQAHRISPIDNWVAKCIHHLGWGC